MVAVYLDDVLASGLKKLILQVRHCLDLAVEKIIMTGQVGNFSSMCNPPS